MVVGIDEVGRGCIAGPVCVAAVALEGDLDGLNDSKKLSAPQRRQLASRIKQTALSVGIGWASRNVIDESGITAALRVAALQALQPFGDIELILLDGNHNYIEDDRVATIVDGDGSVCAIAAASVIAKVARDSFMASVHRRYPQYGFAKHVGYGTAGHLAALKTYGPSPVHRLSFAPLKGGAYVD